MVMIDHGLYIREPEAFRQQYCLFWKSLFLNDMKTIKKLSQEWGIGAPDLLASATLMRAMKTSKRKKKTSEPTEPQTEAQRKAEAYAAQVKMKEKIKSFLLDQEKIPQELLFIGRSMRIVQANNQKLGSPVNRIGITARWASSSLANEAGQSYANKVINTLSHLRFIVTVNLLDLGFWAFEMKRWIQSGFGLRSGYASDGFEDEMQKNLKLMAKQNFGIEVNDQAFSG